MSTSRSWGSREGPLLEKYSTWCFLDWYEDQMSSCRTPSLDAVHCSSLWLKCVKLCACLFIVGLWVSAGEGASTCAVARAGRRIAASRRSGKCWMILRTTRSSSRALSPELRSPCGTKKSTLPGSWGGNIHHRTLLRTIGAPSLLLP